ncbi:MAG: hypothetical protein V4471_00530 [Pseudomonadota bacterium]
MPSTKKAVSKRKNKVAISILKPSSSYRSLQEINLTKKNQTKKHYDDIVKNTLPRLFPNETVQSLNTISFAKSDFSALGVVSEDEACHFESTETSQKCAEKFFDNAIKNLRHCAFLKKNNAASQSSKSPRCVSFITATLELENLQERRNLCFVALSGWENNADREELKDAIESSIEKAGASTINGHKFQFIDPCTEGFSEILAGVNGHLELPYSRKPCTEKRVASAVLSLVDEHGSNFKISGISNYGLYPFDEETKDEPKHKAKYPNAVGAIELSIEGQSRFIPEIDSCEDCKQNKFSSLLIMRHYQLNKDEENQGATALPDLIPTIVLSETTNDYLKIPDDCSSISSKKKMNFPSVSPSYASSHSRKSSFSFTSQSSSKSGFNVTFEDDLSQEDDLELENLFEGLMLNIDKDAKKSQKRLNSGFFQEVSCSRLPKEDKFNEKASEKKTKMRRKLSAEML